jgi:pimeloyl-ACP methyl ester carboxylesterase
MEQTFYRRINLGEPLSRVLLPLVLGITRRTLLRGGAMSCERRLGGILTHYYHIPARLGAHPHLPVVLIHGIADSALTWAFVTKGMARIGPVYAVDLPGFGQSGYPPGRRYASIREHVGVIQELIREVIGGPALLVGNSMGGWIAGRTLTRTNLRHRTTRSRRRSTQWTRLVAKVC